MGFIELWLKEYLPKKDRCWITKDKDVDDAEIHTVNLKDMQGCFFVLILGIVFGIMIISVEFCWFYRKKYLTHYVFKPYIN